MRKIFADVSTHKQCSSLFPKTVEEISSLVTAAKDRATTSLKAIYGVDAATRNFQNTARATDLAESELSVAGSLLSVLMNTSAQKELRDEARKQIVDIQEFSIENFSTNKELYKCFQAYQSTPEFSNEAAVTGQQRYWLTEQIADYKRSGLDLEGADFDEVVSLQKKIAALSTTFSANSAEDKTELYFAPEALVGTPESVLKGLAKKDGDDTLLVVKLDYPTYFGIMKNCEVADTRRQMSLAFENRAFPQNMDVLKDVIRARHQLATKLGYVSFAAYNLADKMIKTPQNASTFIDSLIPGLQKKWALEKQVICENLHPSVVLTPTGDIENYDIAFSINQVKMNKLAVSETDIKEYFPMDATVQALFDIYQAFFDITFVEHKNGNDLWHEDVTTLEVVDNKTKALLGHIIMDLFPREGKFSHACCHPVVPAVEGDDATDAVTGAGATFSPVLTVVLANFPKPSADAPALFLHDDVETFFHEFGHAIHNIMGRSRMATHAGTSVKRDFVELPSQMLEEWLWEEDILKKVSKHYKTGLPLPDTLIKSKIASQSAFSGRDSLRQLCFARYSLNLFSEDFYKNAIEGSTDSTSDTFMRIQKEILTGIHYSEGSHFECAFGHLMGYGAGYYGYMWSEVLAQDVFSYIKAKNGLLSAELGRRYVEKIVGVGGGRDPNDMVREFLEREPNSDAFLKKLGIEKQ